MPEQDNVLLLLLKSETICAAVILIVSTVALTLCSGVRAMTIIHNHPGYVLQLFVMALMAGGGHRRSRLSPAEHYSQGRGLGRASRAAKTVRRAPTGRQ